MPCAFARIRTSFSCTSICRLVASASCQLPVGTEQWSVPAPGEALEADTLFPTDDWQLPLAWQLSSATLALVPTDTGILRPDPSGNWQLALTTNLLFFLIPKRVGPCVRT